METAPPLFNVKIYSPTVDYLREAKVAHCEFAARQGIHITPNRITHDTILQQALRDYIEKCNGAEAGEAA